MAVLELSFECKEDTLSVRSFTVHEGLSKLFEVSIVARSPNEDVDLDAIVGKSAGFLMMGGTMVPHAWTGVVSHMEQVEVEAPRPGAMGLSTYALRIVPSMWLLTQRRENRIFQHMTVPAIVEKILGEYGIKPQKKLAEAHPEHEYRVQYGETDFAFVSRLLEEEGISFYFVQVSGEQGIKSELVLNDRPHANDARGPLRYVDHPNEAAKKEFITNVHVGHGVRPGRFTIRDFDFTKPDFVLLGNAEKAKAPEDFYEQYLYEHGAFVDDKAGKTRADIALQAQRRTKRVVTYEGNAFDLAPGVVFPMDGHPRADLAPSKKLLVLDTTTRGTATGEWTMSGSAAFAAEPHRPAQSTQKPTISGVQSAVVVGPKGEEIHTDEHGRVRVQFHWDRDGKFDDKSSCWIRVSQGWAGAAYGMMTIPRIGQEVLVSFWEGNPDEPVIVGRVYNNKNRVPYKLPDEKTKSTWKSDSSPNSSGFNEIMFEDKKGQELVFVQAQKDLSKLVKHDETERTGATRTIVVGKDRSSIVAAVDTTLVGEKYQLVIVKPKELNIAKMAEPEVEAKETMIEVVDQRITMTTGKATVELDGDTITLKADGNIKIKAGSDVVVHGGPFVKINC
jgi:type VI secretion system secreted protein VgrG